MCEQCRWHTETCQLYSEAARTVGEAERSNAVMRECARWEQVLRGDWMVSTGGEEDMACPTTAAELAHELLETMRPDGETSTQVCTGWCGGCVGCFWPCWGALLVSRRAHRRGGSRTGGACWRGAGGGRPGKQVRGRMCVCLSVLDSPGALRLPDPLPGADRVDAKERRRNRPY